MIDINELRQSLGAVQPEEAAVLLNRLEEAESDALEQARMNGMGASLEAAETAWKVSDKSCYDLTEKVIPNLRDQLEAAEKEVESWKGLAEQFGNEADALRAAVRHEADCVDAAKAEIEALRAKVEAMEKQEPSRGWWDDLIADISAIDCMYRGSPTYAHDAYWMRDRVVWMLKQRRDSTPGVNGEAK